MRPYWLVFPLFLVGCEHTNVASQVAEFNEANDVLALKALQALGAKVPQASERRCRDCHSVSRAKVREWRQLTQAAEATGCMPKSSRRYLYKPRNGDPNAVLAELNPTCSTEGQTNCYLDPASALVTPEAARKMVDCMRVDPAIPTTPFDPGRLGIYSIEAHERNSHYKRLFEKAYPDSDEAQRQRNDFVRRMKMPRGSLFSDQIPDDADPNHTIAIPKEDFWAVREWFDRGLPALDATLPEEAAPTECVPRITEELKQYLKSTARGGWTLKNASDAMAMHGCPSDTLGGWPDTALACLTTETEATDWEASYTGDAAGTKVRRLYQIQGRTSYWTRSSADGRFVGSGGSFVTDLVKKIQIPIDASYDPGFLPDNSTFMFQGTSVGAGFCPQDLLLNPPMENGQLVPIDFSESGCGGTSSIPLYQHLGTSLGGGASFAANGDYTSDNGGHSPADSRNPSATAGPSASMTITPIVRSGTGYDFLPAVERATPFEGDTAISPTSALISARLSGGQGAQLGITIRRVALTQTDGTWSVSLSPESTVCIAGGKAAHSYDDRFMALHQYSSLGGMGKADISIIDLWDGTVTQVTNMPAGKFALFPHFRSDGWLYFLVRDVASGHQEYIGASDIALHIEKSKPINDVQW